MTSPPARSPASADLPPGAGVAGFRVERLIGHGPRATVYEATQLSLGRRVALKLLHDPADAARVRGLSWPEHPGAVSLFGSGASPHGPWVAMRLVRGGTLETRRAPLDAVAAALDQAHAGGLVHGGVAARNVLVEDGRAYLTDFGLAPGAATAEDDRAALARLVAGAGRRARRRRLGLGAVAGVAVAIAAVAAVLLGGDEAAPAPAPGVRPVGSALPAGGTLSADCAGRPPGGASPACTISQSALGGRPVAVPVDGTITAWAVRGARGTLALQVLRGRGNRRFEVARSADAEIPGPAPHVVRARIAVAAGDRIGLLVTPGAAIGLGPRRGAATDRWFGPLLDPVTPRAPERPAGTGLDRELLLRADVRPGADVPALSPLRGAAAGDAPAGRQLGARDVAVGGGAVRTVAVVALPEGAVAVDLLDGAQRLARAPLPGADGRGRLVALAAADAAVDVRWRNRDGGELERRLRVTPAALR